MSSQPSALSFIEKLSFNAFNEGTRLGHCIKMHKRLFGVDANAVHLAERLAELQETKTHKRNLKRN